MKYTVFILFLLLSTRSHSQSANTMTLGTSKSPSATLNDMAWLAGHWRGEAFGGITEEVWTPPLGGSMMCSFKLVSDGKVKFYELVTLTEEAGTLMLRLKHFHGDLKGWEEKDKTIDFPLVKVEGNRVYFDGMTFERKSDGDMNVFVMIGQKGKEEEVVFPYRKVK